MIFCSTELPAAVADTVRNSGSHFWSFIRLEWVGIIIGISSFTLSLIAIRWERRKFISVFKGGRWFNASDLRYELFREARPDTAYLHRNDIESVIIEEIQNRKHLVLTGTPLRGKTRTMVECLKKMKGWSVLIPYPGDYSQKILFPRLWFRRSNRRIVVFNDIQKFFEPGRRPEKLIDVIREKGWLMVANCRTMDEWKTLKRAFGVTTDIFHPIEIPPVDERMAREAALLNGLQLPRFFDGKNIGSVFVDLDAMRDRYETHLTLLQKQILLSLKHLQVAGFYNQRGEIALERIKILTEKAGISQSDSEWGKNIEVIIDKEFVSGTFRAVIPEQIYLDLIVEPRLTVAESIRVIRAAFPDDTINYHRLVYSAANKEEAAAILLEADRVGVKPNNSLYNMLIAKQESYEQGKSLLVKMKANGLFPNPYNYNTLLTLCNSFEEGAALILEMKGSGVDPDIITYNTLMNLCNDYKQGRNLLVEIRAVGLIPDVVTYTSLMKSTREFSKRLEIMAEMNLKGPKPNIYTYNTLISVCKDFQRCNDILQEMKSLGIPPDVFSYTILMNLIPDFETGKAVIREMRKENVKPFAITYNALAGLCNSYDEVRKLILEMKRTGVQPDIVTYNILINRCKSLGQARLLLPEITLLGLTPDVITFTEFIILSDGYEEAAGILTEMTAMNVTPNIVTYTVLLEKVETKPQAIDWLKKFCSTSLVPNTHLNNSLKKIAPILYESPELMDMLLLMLRFNPMMFFIFLKNWDIPEILVKFTDLFKEDSFATDFIKLGFADQFLRFGDLENCRRFLDQVTEPNHYYNHNMAYYWFLRGDFVKAEETYLKALDLAPNEKDRAKTHVNLAKMIRSLNQAERIESGLEHCRKAVALSPENFPEAKQLLAFFTILSTPVENLPVSLQDLKAHYNIGKGTIKKILFQIEDPEKRAFLYHQYQENVRNSEQGPAEGSES